MIGKTSVVFGMVRDHNGNPISNARVSFVEGPVPLQDIAALTDNKGTFALSAPIAGEYVIEVVSDKFIKKKEKITIEGNQEKHIDISLS